MKGYHNLQVYREAHALVKMVYAATERFPKHEIFGLISQMRRAAVSVVANILEGHARKGKRELHRFLDIANGSLIELEYYIELSTDLKYLSLQEHEELEKQRVIVGSLLGGLLRYSKKLTAQIT
jgi:four helix bundle protein